MTDIYNRRYHLKHTQHATTETGLQLNQWRSNVVMQALSDVSVSTDAVIVDWGCGGSGFLRAMAAGESIIGVDVNPYSIAHAVNLGFRAYTPDMFDEFCAGELGSSYTDAGYKVITFWDVFEHLQDPRAFLQQYQPDMLVLSLPCLDGFYKAYGLDADIQLWKHYRPLEHLWNFTEDSLRKFLQGCGYSTVQVLFGESNFRKDKILGEKNIMTFVATRDKK